MSVKINRKNIDIQIYDARKCFDKMWSSETSKNLYNAGLRDDNFVLVSKANESCQAAVKTSWGNTTNRVTLNNRDSDNTLKVLGTN